MIPRHTLVSRQIPTGGNIPTGSGKNMPPFVPLLFFPFIVILRGDCGFGDDDLRFPLLQSL